MVKGTNRRVIVVKSPDPRIFEEAIFILKEEYMKSGGSPEGLLEEAQRAAGDYLRKTKPGRRTQGKAKGGLLAAGAAVMAGAVWAAMRFVAV